ncbi:MAG: aldo/keto reductase [Planctomycetota bacterium]
MTPATHLRWGILGAGRIAGAFASDLKHTDTGTLVAVASRSKEKADAFAKEHAPGARGLGSYDELLSDAEVDAVYVATPHPQHAEWTIKLLRAGKHVLCEKPVAINWADAEAMFEAARLSDRILMEAFMYRCHPVIDELVRLLREKVIGDVQFIDAAFSFRGPDKPEQRLLNPDLGGGGILDVGCYAVSIARLVAGAAVGGDVAEPTSLKGVGHLGKTGVDEWAAATAMFPGGIVASLRTGVRLNAQNGLTVYGSGGKLSIDQPFIPARHGGESTIVIEPAEGDKREIAVPSDKPLYALEAEAFAKAVVTGGVSFPAMTPADTLGNMRALDTWREQIGLAYPAETLEHYSSTTIVGEPLARQSTSTMPTAKVGEVPFEVSKFLMGCDNQHRFDRAAVLYDAFFEYGGNGFDTAHVYGRTRSALLGQWIKHRNVRDQVAVICKGAHTPRNFPHFIRGELMDQLGWLGTDYCDLYFLHRDNPDVPAGEFVDVLSELADEGLIRGGFGGSNWTLSRLKEAQDYASKKGVRGFTVMSQNLSLAEMVDPVWRGCESAHADDWMSYLAETGLTNFAWSSQARGFFVPDRDLDEAELNRCWVSDANMERRKRCFELAEQRGVEPISIAAAWVLKQAFPSFALIGPRNLRELHTSLPGLSIELTDAEHAWLDLKRDTPADS